MKYIIMYEYLDKGQFELQMNESYVPSIGDLIVFRHQDGTEKQSIVKSVQVNIDRKPKIYDLYIVLKHIYQ